MNKITLINADVLLALAGMSDESVQMVCCSPPYWGLRDYGTPGQIGLEPTIEEFVDKMVEVFREVRRVMRKDGVLFLNLGSSYASGGRTSYDVDPKLPNRGHSFHPGSCDKRPSQPHPGVHPCGSDDKGQSGFQGRDHVCHHSDGECQGDSQNHHGRTSRIDQPLLADGGRPCTISHDKSPGGCAASLPDASPLSVPGSTKPGFWLQLRAGCSHSDNPFSCPSFSDSCFPAIHQNGDKGQNTCDKSLTGLPLGCHTGDMVLSSEALEPPCSITNSLIKALGKVKLKPKDLVATPWLVALALQADGWWLRSDIIWAKPNPMPESCTDRPTKAHEYIFLLTKSAKYFYDADAVKEESITGDPRRPYGSQGSWAIDGRPVEQRHGGEVRTGCDRKALRSDIESRHRANIVGGQSMQANPNGSRNLRTVWEIATAPFPQAHFATYPPELVRRCVAAGTSEKGCCQKCGAPWRRVVEKSGGTTGAGWNTHNRGKNDLAMGATMSKATSDGTYKIETLGWSPTCGCCIVESEAIPCTVLDPFSGAGTTALVAAKMGRDAIGIELNPAYVEMSRKRISGELGMLVEIEVKIP